MTRQYTRNIKQKQHEKPNSDEILSSSVKRYRIGRSAEKNTTLLLEYFFLLESYRASAEKEKNSPGSLSASSQRRRSSLRTVTASGPGRSPPSSTRRRPPLFISLWRGEGGDSKKVEKFLRISEVSYKIHRDFCKIMLKKEVRRTVLQGRKRQHLFHTSSNTDHDRHATAGSVRRPRRPDDEPRFVNEMKRLRSIVALENGAVDG